MIRYPPKIRHLFPPVIYDSEHLKFGHMPENHLPMKQEIPQRDSGTGHIKSMHSVWLKLFSKINYPHKPASRYEYKRR